MDADDVIVLLAAGPRDPGAGALWARIRERARAGEPVRILLSHEGLAWADDPRLEELRALPAARIGVCSRQARDAGWTLATAPAGVEWSALVAWLRDAEMAEDLWVALP